jgi:hypothetical protein
MPDLATWRSDLDSTEYRQNNAERFQVGLSTKAPGAGRYLESAKVICIYVDEHVR